MHWVEASQAVPAEFRLYEPLISAEEADEAVEVEGLDSSVEKSEPSFLDQLNPKSIEILQGFVEPALKDSVAQDKFQFFRHGYFNVDSKYSAPGHLVFNLIVSLKSSFQPPKQG
ncbi:Glutamine--tRNA ligase [compost metagenome]